ncbi:hypothetical protein H4R34_002717 [Dimargaris verticillata]|uniref:Peroxisomal-coenzyme A synthetase n=1 Tax=Dimargaris verticillata TaxID=2761393 RepID=A0A9W8E909_9FUNG|nr:hypothetical protein H4R34_002717 [Dimargaris verticillata]
MSATLTEVFRRASPSYEAVVTTAPHKVSLTYQRLERVVKVFQAKLWVQHLRPGDTVAYILPNSLEGVVAFLGITLFRCTAAPLNAALAEDEFIFYLQDSGAKVLLVPAGTDHQHPALKAARCCLGCAIWEVEWNLTQAHVQVTPFWNHHILERQLGPSNSHKYGYSMSHTEPTGQFACQPDPEDIALLLHTSGTTGKPKAVPLTHANLVQSMRNIAATYQFTPADRGYLVMPLFHVHGLVAGLLAPLFSGSTVIVPPKFSASHFWSDIIAHRCTWYSAVPTIHQILLRRPAPSKDGGHCLRFIRSCSSALAPSVHEQLEKTFGVPVLEAYAMTEAAHQMTSNPLPPAARKAGSVGLPQGVEVSIRDDGGQRVAGQGQGEVCVRGHNVTHGYLNNPHANATSFYTGGWFRTGDQGFLDSDGYLVITGRIKELINRGGEKISPLEVDATLLRHPKVADGVSFAVPDPIYGQEVHAAVVPRANCALTEQEVQVYCRKSLAAFKTPKKVYIVQDFPRTATGKVQRRIVAAHFGKQPTKAKL